MGNDIRGLCYHTPFLIKFYLKATSVCRHGFVICWKKQIVFPRVEVIKLVAAHV
jgi:hypothetical protein